YSEADPLVRDALDRSRKVFGDDHPQTVMVQELLAMLLASENRHEESIPLFLDSIPRARKAWGPNHGGTLSLLHAAATELSTAGRLTEAEMLEREALAGLIKQYGPDYMQTVSSGYNLAVTLERQQKWPEALPIAKDIYDRLHSPHQVQIDPRFRAQYLSAYGICLSKLTKDEEAIEPLTRARAAMIDAGIQSSGTFRDVLICLIRCTDGINRPDDTATWRAE